MVLNILIFVGIGIFNNIFFSGKSIALAKEKYNIAGIMIVISNLLFYMSMNFESPIENVFVNGMIYTTSMLIGYMIAVAFTKKLNKQHSYYGKFEIIGDTLLDSQKLADTLRQELNKEVQTSPTWIQNEQREWVDTMKIEIITDTEMESKLVKSISKVYKGHYKFYQLAKYEIGQ